MSQLTARAGDLQRGDGGGRGAPNSIVRSLREGAVADNVRGDGRVHSDRVANYSGNGIEWQCDGVATATAM